MKYQNYQDYQIARFQLMIPGRHRVAHKRLLSPASFVVRQAVAQRLIR
jgi:hypothetical protein